MKPTDTIDDTANKWVEAAMHTIDTHLIPPPPAPGPVLPDFFSESTKAAIKARDEAFKTGDEATLRDLEKKVVKGRRRDKRKRLDTKIADGSWDTTGSIRKPPGPNPACLIDRDGNLKSAKYRANVFAKYLETEQFGKVEGHQYVIPEILRNASHRP